MGATLAESQNYLVASEYEKVFLIFKNRSRKIYIGDFYGDPQGAVVSHNESFCVMVGCGLIIYYLHEPFAEFCYNASNKQWRELFRESGKEWWIEDVAIIDEFSIMFTAERDDECGGRYELKLDDFELKRHP